MHRWHAGRLTGRFNPGPRTSFEPALAELEEARKKALAEDDRQAVVELDERRDALLEMMYPGLSTMAPCSNCNRRGHEFENCPRPRPKRRWQCTQKEVSSAPERQDSQPLLTEPVMKISTSSEIPEFGKAVWLLGSRCVELSLPSGAVRCSTLPCDVKPGSRAVSKTGNSGEIFVLENGSSSIFWLRIGDDCAVQELTKGREASRFRSSLGSRFILCGADQSKLLVTGTPGSGAHTPWVFDIRRKIWERLPEASYPILSSAVATNKETVTIVGGWSKGQGCHGNIQVLSLEKPPSWTSSNMHAVPWRRPGAMAFLGGQLLLALGWMECDGAIGTPGFRLLRRNGAAQGARTSSSKLCTVSPGVAPAEVTQLPLPDSFEHSGELHPVGDEFIVCIGRDHVQAYCYRQASWQSWPLPTQLRNDGSNSWVKHCGSWALAWMAD